MSESDATDKLLDAFFYPPFLNDVVKASSYGWTMVNGWDMYTHLPTGDAMTGDKFRVAANFGRIPRPGFPTAIRNPMTSTPLRRAIEEMQDRPFSFMPVWENV